MEGATGKLLLPGRTCMVSWRGWLLLEERHQEHDRAPVVLCAGTLDTGPWPERTKTMRKPTWVNVSLVRRFQRSLKRTVSAPPTYITPGTAFMASMRAGSSPCFSNNRPATEVYPALLRWVCRSGILQFIQIRPSKKKSC